jgi:hypothetical protein
MKVEYIKKSTLGWTDLWQHLGMSKDSGGRWYPTSSTPEWVEEYLKEYRSPSRSWPNSYAAAMLSQKFAKLLCHEDPRLAIKLEVAKEI